MEVGDAVNSLESVDGELVASAELVKSWHNLSMNPRKQVQANGKLALEVTIHSPPLITIHSPPLKHGCGLQSLVHMLPSQALQALQHTEMKVCMAA